MDRLLTEHLSVFNDLIETRLVISFAVFNNPVLKSATGVSSWVKPVFEVFIPEGNTK